MPTQPDDTPGSDPAADDRRQLSDLRHVWGMAPDAPLVVVGELREVNLGDRGAIYFLEQLEDPATGRALLYPQTGTPQSFRTTAFVPRQDALRILDLAGSEEAAPRVMAELELSPRRERLKHNNPNACSVRPGSLRLLSALPETWNIQVTGRQEARMIAASARAAIEAGIRSRLSDETRDHERRSEAARQKLRADETAIQEGAARLQHLRELQTEAGRALDDANDRATEARENLAALRDHCERERRAMETRLDSLTDLVRRKGERLVALDLLDERDLLDLLPPPGAPDTRDGRGLDDVLDGDFSRLAALVQARLWRNDMIFSRAQLQDFLALLRTSDLVILAGESGSGKTSLVKSLAETIGARCTVIAVKPNWTGPEDLLGYFNPIERNYQTTPFLQALLAAAKEPDVPHFILLDEMNLARVEHYFADFLSLLETRSRDPEIPLFTTDEARHVIVENGLFLSVEAEARLRAGLPDTSTFEDLLKDEGANRYLHLLGGFQNAESVLLHHARLRRALSALVHVPDRLAFPPNVRIIGAINVDDTTYDLSPKVLDRAHVVRFGNPLLADWDALEAEIEPFDEALLSTPLRLTAADFGARADYPAFDRRSPRGAWLAEIVRKHLDPLGVEFGLRAMRQALGYLDAAEAAGIDATTALNNVVLHKILPKITLDTERTAADGRSRRDVLIALRDALAHRIDRAALSPGADSCVLRLDRLIELATQNNGIANYWFR